MENNVSGRPGVMIYFDVLPCLERLTGEEKGELFEAIMNYARFGILPQIGSSVGIAFDFMRPRIDLDADAYENKKEAKRRAALTRWHGSPSAENASASDAVQNMPNSNPNPNSDSDTKCSRMADKPPTTITPLPTREEVRRYCQEKGYPIDWEYFYDYYSGNGWKTGKNPISDWKAIVRNWARKEGRGNERAEKNEFSELGTIGTVL